MKVDNGTTNFAVYEDATEFYGMAEATLPEISQITEEVKGAGIAGAFNGAFVGHIEAMTLTLNFRSVTADAIKLAEPRNHQLDLRAAQQYWDNSAGKFIQQAVKHVLMVCGNPGGNGNRLLQLESKGGKRGEDQAGKPDGDGGNARRPEQHSAIAEEHK